MGDKTMVPSFNTILYQRLNSIHGISREVAQKVLEEIAVSTAIYLHESRKLERQAIREATGRGEVIYLAPGEASTPLDNASPDERKRAFEAAKNDYVKAVRRNVPVAVEL